MVNIMSDPKFHEKGGKNIPTPDCSNQGHKLITLILYVIPTEKLLDSSQSSHCLTLQAYSILDSFLRKVPVSGMLGSEDTDVSWAPVPLGCCPPGRKASPPDSGCSPPGVVGGEGALGGTTAACLQEGRRRGAGRSSPSSEIRETMWTRFRLENGV